MSRWKKKKRKWIINHAKKINSKKKGHGIIRGNAPGSSTKRIPQKKDERPYVIQTPPSNFSLVENPEETMAFFMDFANEINRHKYKTHFYVDSQKVKKVTVDALIYLIAILQNDKHNNIYKYSFSGNFPANEDAKKVYTESGFVDYVDSKMKVLPSSNDKIRIMCGTDNNPQSAKELSNFVIECLGKQKKDIHPLQKVLVELMSNVYHHAYDKAPFMAKKWYMYAEHVDDYVRCIFVDTGYGIAKTARKKLNEKVRIRLGVNINDAKIIQSIFNSEFRTSTERSYRGNGLVSVRDNVKTDLFYSFQVLSGRGRCLFPKNTGSDDIVTYCYEHKLYGTLYEFIIR